MKLFFIPCGYSSILRDNFYTVLFYRSKIMKIDNSLLSKVRRIQIKTSRMVTEVFSGEYRSVFKGRGMEFEEVREYQPGDEVRTIDWNVTARMNRPFVKEFREERELTVFFIVDVSSSMGFGSRERIKRELAAELCAVLSFTAIKNRDNVGLLLFSDRVKKYIPAAKGRLHVLRVIRDLLASGSEKQEQSSATDLASALEYFMRVQKKSTVCFVVSDFFCTGHEKILDITGRKHDLTAVRIEDRLEEGFPVSGMIDLEDMETSKQMRVDFSDPLACKMYEKMNNIRRTELAKQFRKTGIDFISIRTGDEYIKILARFFKEKERVRR